MLHPKLPGKQLCEQQRVVGTVSKEERIVVTFETEVLIKAEDVVGNNELLDNTSEREPGTDLFRQEKVSSPSLLESTFAKASFIACWMATDRGGSGVGN